MNVETKNHKERLYDKIPEENRGKVLIALNIIIVACVLTFIAIIGLSLFGIL